MQCSDVKAVDAGLNQGWVLHALEQSHFRLNAAGQGRLCAGV